MSTETQKYYDRIADDYAAPADPYVARYHAKRFEKAVAMLDGLSGRMYDFGCGNGELFRRLPHFDAEGCDLSPAMIAIAKQQSPNVRVHVGGIECFLDKPGPYNVVVCLNTLPYLSEDDEIAFFAHCRKIARHVLISHSNKLFDLVTLNRYTVDFFRRELSSFVSADAMALLPSLLTNANHPPLNDKNASDREIVPKHGVDPFTYRPDGFEVIKTATFNTFPLPPAILQSRQDLRLAQVDVEIPGTLGLLFSSQFQMLLRAH
jgi:SAM-dependent methyltransferase